MMPIFSVCWALAVETANNAATAPHNPINAFRMGPPKFWSFLNPNPNHEHRAGRILTRLGGTPLRQFARSSLIRSSPRKPGSRAKSKELYARFHGHERKRVPARTGRIDPQSARGDNEFRFVRLDERGRHDR